MNQQVLEQLDRIERAAEKILADANAKKTDLKQADEARSAAFDAEVDGDVERQITELRNEILKKSQAEEEAFQQEMASYSEDLELRYRKRKLDIAGEIVKTILA